MPALACEVAASAFLLPLGNAAYVLDEDCVQDPVQGDVIAMKNSHQIWSPNHSADLYKIGGWGAPYFSVNSAGNISVRPHGESTMPYSEIDLMKVVKKVTEFKSDDGLGLQLPVIVRFPDVLRNRLDSLQAAFDSAILDSEYESHYQGVYPVKCNQDQKIVEDIVDFGRPYRFGLEAGSKPELLLAMSALCKGNPDSFLICNGYKDREYISLALLGRKLELKTVIVLEQEEELDLVLEVSKKLGVRPVIGLRAKLRTKHSGHFGSTSGEKGKFGLTTIQVLSVVNKLKRAGMLDCLQLLHFHIGSQIPSVDLLGDGVGEAAQIYCELVRLGAGMKIIDIGGGLGIDYDGTNSPSSDMSVGYGLNEYASAVVRTVGDVCRKKFVKHPILCSESGRALVSHHSVLIFEAVPSVPTSTGDFFGSQGFDFASLVDALSDEGRADYRNLAEAAADGEFGLCLTYVERLKQRCVDEFKEGSLGMVELAAVDSLCEFVSKAVADHGGNSGDDKVNSYHVNLSIFTSIPDFWAIGQLFPIVPIHRLDERPTVKAVLSDLTCDSDGKVNKFIGGGDSLPLHEIRQGDRYCLGMFLGGAYQEALGGLHNLFGNPSVIRVVQSDGPHCFAITGAVPGQSCADVLQAMQHEPAMMFQSLMSRADECLRASMGKSAAPMPEDGEVTDENKAVESIAYSFHSTPYLIGDLAGKWDCHSG